jgi:hypothetical protein
MSRIRTYFVVLTALLATMAAYVAGSPLALAQVAPADPADPTVSPVLTSPPVTVTYGSPVWTFLLVAAGAAIVTTLVVLAVQRQWHIRRSLVPA